MAKKLKEVVISLDDKIGAKKLTLQNIDLPTLREFLEDVEVLIKGDNKNASLIGAHVALEEGSVRLRTFVTAALALNLEFEMVKLEKTGDLDQIQPKRASVIRKWQRQTHSSPARTYAVKGGADLALKVVDTSQFQHRSQNAWVRTKKYLTGEIIDLGGKNDPNIHLLLPSGEIVCIATSKEQILGKEQNPVYRTFTVYIEGDQHLSTKRLENVKLIDFVEEPGNENPEQLEELWRRGEVAWADVQSPGDWLDNLRGNQ